MSTVGGMADLPFGFSAGDDPDRDKPKKDQDPFGMGMPGGEFDMSQLGQIFSKLGEMVSGAGGSAFRAVMSAQLDWLSWKAKSRLGSPTSSFCRDCQ